MGEFDLKYGHTFNLAPCSTICFTLSPIIGARFRLFFQYELWIKNEPNTLILKIYQFSDGTFLHDVLFLCKS